uniref:Mitochondrial carrier protein n=1 Tax=Rhodosorus marinus TaxID=101924 RepID=A0A7S3A6B3_9RHOD|mmetsp:Transcript_45332/g.176112  ORF Transcript_45332/g.176112 Transcript_45332/m.176112 type:complete len:297 (+) Transcript_45332:248-1138(+)
MSVVQTRRKRPVLEIGIDAISAGLAAGCATSLTHPLDTVKTRLQASKLVGLPALRFAIFGNSTLHGSLLTGLKPILIGTSVASALKFSMYQAITKGMGSVHAAYAAVFRAAAASFCALSASSLYVPWEGMKQRMQASSGATSLRTALTSAWQNGGIKSLYRGWLATISRDIPFTMIEMVIYDGLKTFVRKQVGERELTAPESLALGGISGGISAGLTCPVDVLKTRLMTGPVAEAGIRQAALSIVREEGFFALYRGVGARVAIIAPLTAIFFCVFEASRTSIRTSFGIPPNAVSSH